MTAAPQSANPRAYVARRCRESGVALAVFLGPDRTRYLSRLRQDVAMELRDAFPLSLVEIARLIGRASHAHAIYAIRCARVRRDGGRGLSRGGVGRRPDVKPGFGARGAAHR